jgi:hypothetical protein
MGAVRRMGFIPHPLCTSPPGAARVKARKDGSVVSVEMVIAAEAKKTSERPWRL